jgi:hypothetical protein
MQFQLRAKSAFKIFEWFGCFTGVVLMMHADTRMQADLIKSPR